MNDNENKHLFMAGEKKFGIKWLTAFTDRNLSRSVPFYNTQTGQRLKTRMENAKNTTNYATGGLRATTELISGITPVYRSMWIIPIGPIAVSCTVAFLRR